ncbi:hypothetical protein ABID08_006538 [Rhizobium binae]|uniref:Integrase n=1 Tax=Rhizobium binae TaxID=1138190 RepID=A0ABV2MSM6_9HYPH|nr:hypothetical protein [Rhizobium binae]NKL52102.1 hypothetical protein [Rhizobium leguminosarum bv. viciae]QSY83274.1 hypothetical protein J2J99_05520 [Rhizobium binae]
MPRQADEFAHDLAERRAWLASLPHNPKPVLAWPTIERLSRLENPEAARSLYRYAQLMAPPHMIVANDNDPDAAAPEGDPDMRHEMRPGIDEMLDAASPGMRSRVVSAKINGTWTVIERHEPGFRLSGSDVQLGNLVFRSGKLVAYGQTARGRSKTPVERTRQPKGYEAPPKRSQESIKFLLPANDNTPIATGAGWLGGVTRASGNSTRQDHGDHLAAIEMDRNARRAAVRMALGLDAAVLDAAITDATAQQIGEAFGYSGKTAERRGIEKINAAIRKLQEIAT